MKKPHFNINIKSRMANIEQYGTISSLKTLFLQYKYLEGIKVFLYYVSYSLETGSTYRGGGRSVSGNNFS